MTTDDEDRELGRLIRGIETLGGPKCVLSMTTAGQVFVHNLKLDHFPGGASDARVTHYEDGTFIFYLGARRRPLVDALKETLSWMMNAKPRV